MSNKNDRPFLDFEQYNCEPGAKWDEFVKNCMSAWSGYTDDAGYSHADHLLGIDMGGADAGAPAFPVGAVAHAKQLRLFNVRDKKSYAKLYSHISCESAKAHIYTHHFQQGFAAYQYLELLGFRATGALGLKKLDKKFADFNIRDACARPWNSLVVYEKASET